MLRGIFGALKSSVQYLCGCKEQTSFSASLFAPVFKTVKVADILYHMLDRWITIFVVTCKCAWWRRESLFVLPGTNVFLLCPSSFSIAPGPFVLESRGIQGSLLWEWLGRTLELPCFHRCFLKGGWKYDSETQIFQSSNKNDLSDRVSPEGISSSPALGLGSPEDISVGLVS